MEQLEEQINKDIKERLKEHRYLHSIGVMEMAEKLAKHYNLDVKKARLIGLAHDIAKQMTWEEINIFYSVSMFLFIINNLFRVITEFGCTSSPSSKHFFVV